ncbi:serine/threonine-protein phosphatase [Porticoccaceae bacterium]|nr:serine/threonine-protein phosphatase [Porticoccaceae bacterium]MDA8681242.1 serine/threonine-protein phosphatase [Porticoccaceae bacterium]MDA8788682.1 serine/threonine-protein phosphatase [Porticoccaceae bacterium]MDB2343567.1 serine/threonine-protein phosphatase [Porticoccaceae bacterium]MDB2635396.1 serine/threonine-protein phosphatase [Porticoccaceae bacterium]
MSEIVKSALMVTAIPSDSHDLVSQLHLAGWRLDFVADLDHVIDISPGERSDVVIFAPFVNKADDRWLSRLKQDRAFRQIADDNHLIIIIDEPSAIIAIDLFRLGIADIWSGSTQQAEIEASIARIEDNAKSLEKLNAYGRQLEMANLELEQSLHTLRQDQVAGLEVQKNLMPESPLTFGDYEISHSVTPSLYLSGDFVGYNFVLGRYLLFYFADVSGHGASSAFVTVLLRFMIGRVIRRHITENDHKALQNAPEGLLEHINNQILATGLGKHLTMVAGSVDTQNSIMRYVVGAQLPRPILICDGKASYLPGKGKPVGIFEQASWQVEEMQLPERCALVLLSDGVFDLVPDRDLAAKENTLLHYLANSSENTQSLKKALSIEVSHEPQDDISMCLLTRGM